MEVTNASFITTAVASCGYPDSGLPEIAFLGRSNAGKSSLINAMCCRKSLARTGQSPGKTRTINFYGVDGKVSFVDLPGYGYARASKDEMKKWGKMIEDYLKSRKTLAGTVLLTDIRHTPTQDDVMMYGWLRHYKHKVIVAATKSDKLKPSQIPKNLSVIRDTLKLDGQGCLLAFSAADKTGRDSLWEIMDELLRQTILLP